MRKTLIITTILAVAIFITALVIYKNRVAWKLVPENQAFTELYFNNYRALPKTVAAKQTVSFAFTIHNVEGVTTTYPYSVYFSYPDGSQIPFSAGSVTLADNASTSVTVSHTFNAAITESSPGGGSVVVDLTQLNQTIDFLLPNTT